MTKEEALRKIDELKQYVEELDNEWPQGAYGDCELNGVVIRDKAGTTRTIVYVATEGYCVMDKEFFVWTHPNLGGAADKAKKKLTELGYTPTKDQPNVEW